ncbi:MAG: hypothetical protein QXG98_01685 [Candidatus Micrarchaeia archaeon]
MARAQAFSLDLMIGAGALLILLAAYFLSLSDLAARTSAFEAMRAARLRALEASATLLASGEPAAWHALAEANSSTMRALGLAGQPGVLEPAKLARLRAMDYNESRTLLGLEGLNWRLSVLSPNGTTLYAAGLPPEPEIQSIVVERAVVLNASPAKLKLEVWR